MNGTTVLVLVLAVVIIGGAVIVSQASSQSEQAAQTGAAAGVGNSLLSQWAGDLESFFNGITSGGLNTSNTPQ